MLDPIVSFFARLFQLVGRGLGLLVGVLLWPFLWLGRWYGQRGWILRGVVGAILAVIVGLYGYFFYVTQFWNGFDPDYPVALVETRGTEAAGQPLAATGSGQSCKPSAIATVTADLVDLNVNRNAWISSMLVSKAGLFGIEWRNTPFFDNKAAFQLGINQVIRRTTTELVDTLGRVRGTSQIDQNLQDARTAMAWSETAWYIGWRGPTRPSPSVFREGIEKLRAFNASLERCQATFDARADNLMQFLDRMAGDIGSTSDILRQRIEASDAGWFDLRADDRFWFAYGQLYAYYGILVASRSDFASVIAERNLTTLWTRMEQNLRASLNVQPWIISNGNESSAFFPSHLATMGFNLLQVRSNLVEIRSVLDR
ncbi:MAG TPA: DUF2333 family protein [Aquamicrobium sp.]|nr:DUF2333 family protein [Aquamicrobium sp.]